MRFYTRAIICMLGLSLCAVACARKDYGTTQQQKNTRTQQQIYQDLHAPLRAGHQLLHDLLPKAKADTILFELRAGGAKRLNRDVKQSDLWNEQFAIFFKTPQINNPDQSDLFYFDPRAMRIQQLDSESKQVHSIVRSVAVSRKPTFTQNELDVFQFTFRNDPKQGIRFQKRERLSNHLGNNIMPIVMHEHNLVLYTSIDAQDQKRIMKAPLQIEKNQKRIAQLLIEDPQVQSSHPRILSDGSLGIIANPDGYFRAYEFNLAHNLYIPTNKTAAGADNGDLLLSNIDAQDSLLVLKLPDALDLKTLLALANAHNSSINRYRALLAAALIEARRSKLSVLPSVNFGVYYTPVTNIANGNTTASGNFLAEGISRGIFGIVQDLFAIPRNLAMNEAQIVRAEIARDTLLDEINQRQAELADLFFQAQMYQQFLDIDKTLLSVVRDQERRQKHKHKHGVAIPVEVMSSSSSVLAVEKRLDDHQRRLQLLLNEIKDICSIPRGKKITLHTDIYLFEQDQVESFRELKQMALLNNPRIQSARRQLDKAFFEQKTGSAFSPGLSAGAQYGRSHEEFGEFLDEYITLNINGEIPLGAFKDGQLHKGYWQEVKTALRLGQEQQSQNILRVLQRNLGAFHDSRNSFEVQQRHLAHALEQIRLARLFKRYPLAKTAYRQQSKDLPEARELYYQALTETLRQHAQLAQYYTRVWRDMGLSHKLPERLHPIRRDILNRQRFSTWVWNANELLIKDNAIDSFLTAAKQHKVQRAYIYLEADDKVLADPLMSERLTMLINRGSANDIQVWALVGSKDSSDGHMESRIQNSVRNIEQYNKRFKALEPRIGGMKIHLRQAGSADITERKQYQRVLEQTKALMPKGLPLWVDIPMTAFTEDNAHYIREVLHLVDGVTVFNPSGNNQQVLLQSDALLELSPKAMEFALQRDQSKDGTALNKAIRTLQKHHIDKHNFAGIALLDWSQILKDDEDSDDIDVDLDDDEELE